MKYHDLRDFMSQLEKQGELKRIATPVSPHLEMTEIGDRVLNLWRDAKNPRGLAVAYDLVRSADIVLMNMRPQAAKKLGIDPSHVVITVDQHGNTSAASIPLALSVAWHDGRIRKGDLVLIEAMGGGFTWGSALIRW